MRKTKRITLKDREGELEFVIKEMPVMQLESWVLRALAAFSAAGVDSVPVDTDPAAAAASLFTGGGMQALSKLDYDKAKPLLDELLGCAYKVNGAVEEQMTPELVNAVIGDLGTLFRLQVEIFNLHFGFLTDAAKSSTQKR